MKSNTWIYKVSNDNPYLQSIMLTWSACHDIKQDTPPPRRNQRRNTAENNRSTTPQHQNQTIEGTSSLKENQVNKSAANNIESDNR